MARASSKNDAAKALSFHCFALETAHKARHSRCDAAKGNDSALWMFYLAAASIYQDSSMQIVALSANFLSFYAKDLARSLFPMKVHSTIDGTSKIGVRRERERGSLGVDAKTFCIDPGIH